MFYHNCCDYAWDPHGIRITFPANKALPIPPPPSPLSMGNSDFLPSYSPILPTLLQHQIEAQRAETTRSQQVRPQSPLHCHYPFLFQALFVLIPSAYFGLCGLGFYISLLMKTWEFGLILLQMFQIAKDGGREGLIKLGYKQRHSFV